MATVRPQGEQRSVSIDIVRLLGLLLVVGNHLIGPSLGGYVAVFFVLSGYLMTRRRTLTDELAHRVRTLLVPYAGWLIIIGALVLAGMARREVGFAEMAHQVGVMLYGGRDLITPFTAFWFMTAIFVAAMLYTLVRRLPLGARVVTAAAAALATLIGPQLSYWPLSIGVGVCAIVFVAAGDAFRWLEPRLRHRVVTGAVFVILPVIAITTGASERMILKIGDFGTPFVSVIAAVMLSCGALLLAKPLALVLPKAIASRITWVVRMSTPIILLHTVPAWMLPSSPLWLNLLLGLALPLAVGALLLQFPHSRARRILMPGPVPDGGRPNKSRDKRPLIS
ncbi:acyltransferase [Microbacterium sp. NPDC076911]|uniref:acyltransferase n=1 Tax=Microbacterium sp. NPDC076911 TaxID=3154958 RepID=UPI003429D72E